MSPHLTRTPPRSTHRFASRAAAMAALGALAVAAVARAPAGASGEARGPDDLGEPAWESTVQVTAAGHGETRLRFQLTRLPQAEGTGSFATARPREMGAIPYERPADARARAWRTAGPNGAAFAVLVRVPDEGALDVTVEDVATAPAAAPDRGSRDADPGIDPASFIDVGTPGIVRDLRVVPVAFRPFAAADRGVLATSLEVTIGTSDRPGENEKRRRLRTASPAFRRLYESRVLNYEGEGTGVSTGGERPGDPSPAGAQYLVIAYDSFESSVQPLVEWKHKKGCRAKLARLSDVGSTPLEIRSYIETAYTTWDIPPEYVLLVGDTEVLPGYEGLTYTDNYYAAIEGSDYLADIMVGRISADSPGDAATQVAKILGYERTPVLDDPDWPASATLMVADDFDDGDWVYYANTWFIHDLMDAAEFAPIDTLFRRNPLSTQDVYDSVNAGRGFLNYRGQAWYNWMYQFAIDPNLTTNGWKLPVVVSATCATGIFHTDGFICEEWVRAGTAQNPRGGVAFFATNTAIASSVELALRRGYVDEGFFANAFGDDGLTLGEACVAGKLNLYLIADDQLDYEGWNLLGDPSMNLWTGDPFRLDVSHTGTVTIGLSELTVFVTSARGPVEGALVCCVKGTETYGWGHTDANGRAVVPIEPATAGSLSVTVTARNAIPHEGSVLVIESGPLLVFSDLSIDDSSDGNGDGLLSPGETGALSIALENVGNEPATSPVATFRTADAYATVLDSVSAFADAPPGSVVWSGRPYTVSVDADCPVRHALTYSLFVAYSDTETVQYPPPIEIATGRLASPEMAFDDAVPGGDGDEKPDPGESIGLTVTLTNQGPCDLTAIEGSLTTSDPLVAVTSGQAPFGDAPAGAAVANGAVPFILSISPGAPAEHETALTLALTAEGHSYTYSDTVGLSLTIVGSPSTLPTGPDAHGYYAYDPGDTLHGPAATFDWVEIAPPGPGTIMTEITDADAAVTSAPIFFNFRYYGRTYTQISVCSNGFVSMGVTDYRLGDNSPIPDSHGPPNMIAPFWDDLDPSVGGDIYKWYDIANHRFIVEFSEVRHWASADTETFEVILFDPAHHPTPTGDGMILMQYETATQTGGCTVGIEDDVGMDGIQYLYDGTYGEHAAPITDGTALLFTTVPPTVGELPWLVLGDATLDDGAGGNGNGAAEPGETVSLILELDNRGAVDAHGVTVVASTSEEAVSFSDSTAGYPDIPAGGSAQNASDALVFSVGESPADTIATIWASITANEGAYTANARLDVHIGLPATGVPDEARPSAFAFLPCRPNPFSDETAVRLALPTPERVSVRVYAVTGRLVATLADERRSAGEHVLRWDGRDATGRRAASGIYFLAVEAGPHAAREKVVLLR